MTENKSDDHQIPDEDSSLMFKELHFTNDNHREEIRAKCANFWRYVYSQPDLKPLHCNVVGPDCPFCDLNKPSNVSSCFCTRPNECKEKDYHWFNTLMMMNKQGMDVAALAGDLNCRLCKQQEHVKVVFADEDPKLQEVRRKEIEDLNKWQPCPGCSGTNVYEPLKRGGCNCQNCKTAIVNQKKKIL